jgi:hypothetical protein
LNPLKLTRKNRKKWTFACGTQLAAHQWDDEHQTTRKMAGLVELNTTEFRKNPIKSAALLSRSRFPQCFPQLWKSWGRNRSFLVVAA